MTFLQASGALLGRYRLVQRIGEGGMGVVHLALDASGQAVAIKVLRPHVAGDPVARQRLAREVETLRRVRHPRVAAVLDADVDGETPYVVTQYVPAASLEASVTAAGPLRVDALARLGNGLGEALAAIHEAGVVHRDLKPANVLMLDGDPVVIDFGIAHVADDIRLTSTGLVMGTPGYLSPEVLAGQPVVQATDWWGWAAVVAFGATGRPPFGRGPMEVVLDRVRRGEFDLDGVPAVLVPVLSRALDPNPAHRPPPYELHTAVDRLGAAPAVGGSDAPTGLLPVLRSPAHEEATSLLPADRGSPSGVSGPRAGAAATRAMPADVAAPHPYSYPPPSEPQPYASSPPPRAPRTGTLLAALVAFAAVAAVVPVVAATVGLAGSVLARSVDRTAGSLLRRRHEYGPRRGDAAWVAAAAPVHLVPAVLAALSAAILPVLVGVATAFLIGWVLGPAGAMAPGNSAPLATGALAAALTAWWGPGGGSLRRGSRAVVRGLSPGWAGAQVAVAVLVVVAAAALIVVVQTAGEPDWTPLNGPPLGIGQ